MEWFSAAFPEAPEEETLDGVRIVRAGRQWTVHLAAFRRYRRRLAKHFDVVVDEVNTMPFFTPLWSDVPSVMFIHQLAREVWWYESPLPISVIGFFAESHYLRFYRRSPVITVSASTRQDLLEFGFDGPMTVIPQGVEAVPGHIQIKPASPTFLYVGRLSPSKRVADIIRAFANFSQSYPGSALRLVGRGSPSHVQALRKLAKKLGVSDQVRLLGHLSAAEKHREMAQAHVLLLASVREGWGLVVTEANAFGTPAIAYDVPGLRDSIRNGQTGVLVRPSPSAMAEAMAAIWHDLATYQRLADSAREWSTTFSLDSATSDFRGALLRAATTQGITAP